MRGSERIESHLHPEDYDRRLRQEEHDRRIKQQASEMAQSFRESRCHGGDDFSSLHELVKPLIEKVPGLKLENKTARPETLTTVYELLRKHCVNLLASLPERLARQRRIVRIG